MDDHALLWYLQFNSGALSHRHPGAYLFGTMHSAHQSALVHIPRVTDYIHQATQYYAESDLDSPLFQSGISSAFTRTKGLDNLVKSRLYAKAAEYLDRYYGLQLDRFIQFPPMVVSAMISEKLMGAGAGLALDLQLWNIAKGYNLTMDGIESPLEQQNIYKRIPIEYQVHQLKGLLKHISKSSQTLAKLSEAYAQQDLMKLYKISKSSLGPIRDILLYERNKIMADRVMHLLKNTQQLSFIAIGAAHLPGVKGILRSLKQQGVSLQPIRL